MKKLVSVFIILVILLTNLSFVYGETNAGTVQVTDFSETTDGTWKIVTVMLYNSGDSAVEAGVGVTGYDAAGNPLEARGHSSTVPSNSERSISLYFEAGSKISEFKIAMGKGYTTGEIGILGYGSYYDAETGYTRGTIVLENGLGIKKTIGGGLIAYGKNGQQLEARGGSYFYLDENWVVDLTFNFYAGEQIARVEPVAGTGKDTGGFGILGYGSYYDQETGETVGTAIIENRTGVDDIQTGVGIIGFDEYGNSLQACGYSSISKRSEVGDLEVNMSAGNKIKSIKVVTGTGKNTGELSVLGAGSYYDESEKVTRGSIVVENRTGSECEISSAMVGYDQSGKIIDVRSGYDNYEENEIDEIEVWLDGNNIKSVKGCVYKDSQPQEIVGYAIRADDSDIIGLRGVITGGSSNFKGKALFYGTGGKLIESHDFDIYQSVYGFSEYFVVPDGYKSVAFKFYGSNGSEITKRRQLINISTAAGATETTATEYVYDAVDPGESVVLPVERLKLVKDAASASEAVTYAAKGMTMQQKASPTGVDRITLFAEEVVAQAASKSVQGNEIAINMDSISELIPAAGIAKTETEKALLGEGIEAVRQIDTGVKFKTTETESVTVSLDPEMVDAEVDNVMVETPEYAFSIDSETLKTNVGDSPLVITIAEDDTVTGATAGYPVNFASLDGSIGAIAAYGVENYLISAANTKSYKITFNKPVSENIKVSLPPVAGDTTCQAVVNSKGEVAGGKYNPATGKLDVKVKAGDTYTVKYNKKDFTDIQKKSKEMQEAITVLASKGIIGGTGGSNFSPDAPITRAEIAALILRTVSKLDANADGGFTDIKKSDWYYGAAGSAKKYGIINGTNAEGTLFSPKANITKDQIVAISARTLSSEMKYKVPSDVNKYLGTYTDGSKIPEWGKGDIALATRENLVVKRADGKFAPTGTMTRGDAAIILYRMFKKIW